MQVQQVRDKQNNILGVFIAQDDWEVFEKELRANKFPLLKIDRIEADLKNDLGKFSNFSLVEVSHSTLSNAYAYYCRMIMSEKKKVQPDMDAITTWRQKANQINELENNSATFSSIENMQDIIVKYSPVLNQ